MGGPNLDRLPREDWRASAETVGEMHAKAWDVISKCHGCGLMMRTNLRLLIRLGHADLSLWNRREPCRRLGCDTKMHFMGRPPELSQHFGLDAQWPARKARLPLGDRR